MPTSPELHISLYSRDVSHTFAITPSLMRISLSPHPIVPGKAVIDPQSLSRQSPPYDKGSTTAIVDIRTSIMAARCQFHRSCVELGMRALWRGAGKAGSASNGWQEGSEEHRKREEKYSG